MQTWEVFAVFAGKGEGKFMTLYRVKEGETLEGVKVKIAKRIPPSILASGAVKVLHGTLMVDPTPVDLGVAHN